MDDLQTAISRAAKLAWCFSHHEEWGWQHEDPRRYGERRSSDHGILHEYEKALAKKITDAVDRYYGLLERREDKMSPHSETETRLQTAFRLAPDRSDRCPDCGTRLLVIGAL